MTVVIGTAGHIDHGKTTLLRALTGIDADRLPEEQRRGMTIDVGYAHLDLDDGTSIDFVDVPGHDALIGNMLVGAGEIDAMLLVVAADDGVRPQTVEHLALLDALGLTDGVVAVTKTDLVPAARAVEVADAVAALLRETVHLAGRPIVGVSSADGAGMDALRTALLELRERVLARQLGRPPTPTRLAIDRAFSVKGRGVVVTGTLRGGPLRVGDHLRLVPGEIDVRVRGLQVHHLAVEAAEPGRVAVHLAGPELADLARGAALLPGRGIAATDRVLVALERPALMGPAVHRGGEGGQIGWPPADGSRLRLHLGTAAVEAVVGQRGREALALPDGRVTAILRLRAPIATFAGDRAILRRPSPGDVVAGVTVLDPAPATGLSRRRATAERLATLARAVGDGEPDAILDARVGLHGILPTESGLILAPDIAASLESAALAAVSGHHATEPASPGLPAARLQAALRAAARRTAAIRRSDAAALDATIARLLDDLVVRRRLAREGDRYRDPGRAAGLPPALAAAMDRLVALLDVPAPPGLAEAAHAAGCPPEGIRGLEAAGRIVRVDRDLAWAAPTFQRLAAQALALARRSPLSPAILRDATGTSRRYVMPLIEDLDRRGILVRTPAGHVPGPRAPREVRGA